MKVAMSALLVLAIVGGTAYAAAPTLQFRLRCDAGVGSASGWGATADCRTELEEPGAASRVPRSEISELPRYPIFDSPITLKPVAPPPKKPPPPQHPAIGVGWAEKFVRPRDRSAQR